MKNIEPFHAYALQLFGELYDIFPLGRTLDPAAIAMTGGLAGEGEYRPGNH